MELSSQLTKIYSKERRKRRLFQFLQLGLCQKRADRCCSTSAQLLPPSSPALGARGTADARTHGAPVGGSPVAVAGRARARLLAAGLAGLVAQGSFHGAAHLPLHRPRCATPRRALQGPQESAPGLRNTEQGWGNSCATSRCSRERGRAPARIEKGVSTSVFAAHLVWDPEQ